MRTSLRTIVAIASLTLWACDGVGLRGCGGRASAKVRRCRDPRVPWYAKLAAIAVAAYALSPIDLTPDFIPIIGYLDDLLIVPAGILLAVKLVPPNLMAEFRVAATSAQGKRALGKR